MRRLLALVLACTLPLPAWALSCMPHTVEGAYAEADAAAERFVVVRGVLEFDKRLLPKVDFARQMDTPPMTLIPARLRGEALRKDGFTAPFVRELTLAVACYGPWCAQPESGKEVLAFVEQGTAGDVLATNPCGGYLFAEPSAELIRRVQACFAGAECVPETR